MIKKQISRRIQIHILRKNTILFVRFFCLFFTGKSDDPIFKAIAQSIHQMRLLRTDAPCDLYDPVFFFPVLYDFLIVCQLGKRRK